LEILSPDTNIFVKSHLGKSEKEKTKYTLIIIKECKEKQSVLVKSVKNEFENLINEAQTIIEAIIIGINDGKNLNSAIKEIDAKTNLIDVTKIESGLPILGFDTKGIEKDKEKRTEFVTNISEKFNEIRNDFAYESATYFSKDGQDSQKINQTREELKEDFEKINENFKKIVEKTNKTNNTVELNEKEKKLLHKEDQEHWIRTALFKKAEQMTFLTADYFGIGKNNKNLTKIQEEIENRINTKLKTNFAFSFR